MAQDQQQAPGVVVLRLLGGQTEELPATPTRDGRHRLTASSTAVPLAAGDLVTCSPGPDGRPHVVDVHPSDAVLTVFQPAETTDPDALVAFWQATGAGPTRAGGPFLVTAWPGVPMDAVAQQLNADEDAGKGQWILAAEQHERVRAAQSEVDFG